MNAKMYVFILIIALMSFVLFLTSCIEGGCDNRLMPICLDIENPDESCTGFCTYATSILIKNGGPNAGENSVIESNLLYGGRFCFLTPGRASTIEIFNRAYCCDGTLACIIYSDSTPKPRHPCDESTTEVKIKLHTIQIKTCSV